MPLYRASSQAAQTLEVAKSGKPFTSVVDAINTISDSSPTKPYLVLIYPGVYTEIPFTIPANVTVTGTGIWYEVILQTNNNSANFITGSPDSTLAHVAVVGPTDPGFAAINYASTSTTPFFLYNVIIRAGYYGIHVHPVGYGIINCNQVSNQYVGTVINQFIRITNGSAIFITTSFVSGVPGAVTTGCYISGATSTVTMDGGAFYDSGATDAIFADDGASIRLSACTISAATNGIHVGSTFTGTDTTILASGCLIKDAVTKCILTDTNNCNVEYSGILDRTTLDLTAGTTASIVATADDGLSVVGEITLGTSTADTFPLGSYSRVAACSGVATGGGIERTAGLGINVIAGTGYINDGTKVSYVHWNTTPINLTASKNQVWIVVTANNVVQEELTDPGNKLVVILGCATTSAAAIMMLATRPVELPQGAANLSTYAKEVVGPISVSGCTTTKHDVASLELNVDDGVFYILNKRRSSTGAIPITFTYWYRDSVVGKWKFTTGNTLIDDAYYDNGSGTLQALGVKFKRDLLFLTVNDSGTEYHVIYGQTLFDDAPSALTNPNPPDALLQVALRLAAIVVDDTGDITTVYDQLPRIGQLSAGGTAVTVHAGLGGLNADDHGQYQLRTEKGAINGYCGLTAGIKVDAAYLDLAAAPPGTVAVGAGAVGAATLLAKEDHNHDISVAVPVAVGSANAEGLATSLARSNHVHDHGNQTVTTHHAEATIIAAGFLSAADKVKINNSAQVTNAAPEDVTKSAAVVGASTEAARANHKHDVSTAAPVSGAIAVGNVVVEGNATSLARSNHIHEVIRGTPISVGTANAAGNGTDFVGANHVHSGLTRGLADFDSFAVKATPAANDIILIEDSAALLAKKKITVTSLIGLVPVFGSGFAYGEKSGTESVTGTVWTLYYRLTTAVLIAGTYRIGFTYQFAHNATNTNFESRVRIDSTNVVFTHIQEVQDAASTQRNTITSFAYPPLSGAAHTIDIDYHSLNAGDTAYVHNAKIEIWRVS